MTGENVLSHGMIPEDSSFDVALRPKRFSDFIGQELVKKTCAYILRRHRRGEMY